jgi:hypothetical protein
MFFFNAEGVVSQSPGSSAAPPWVRDPRYVTTLNGLQPLTNADAAEDFEQESTEETEIRRIENAREFRLRINRIDTNSIEWRRRLSR